MERIDKIISSQTSFSRREVKNLISKKRVKLNEKIVNKPEEKVRQNDIIKIDDKELIIKTHIYLILNKPKGYVSATKDEKDKTVLDLVPDEYKSRELFPAGRLDKDTTGLMIITDDGEFSHNILSPRKHVKKVYDVTIDVPVTNDMKLGFEKGIRLSDAICKEARLEKTGEYEAKVTIREGRYHQIKRMFGVYGAKVIKLHRIMIGNLRLPENLKEGEIRELTEKELLDIQEK